MHCGVCGEHLAAREHESCKQRWMRSKGLAEHTKDKDCIVGDVTGWCLICHVAHGDPCPDCGARAYHKPNCKQMSCNYCDQPLHEGSCAGDIDEEGRP